MFQMVDGALMLIVMVTMEFIFAVSVYMISFDFSLIDSYSLQT
jgi:hypothetical protein